jgi:hypothetical protein
MGADGATIGKAIRFTQELDLQGALNPDWFYRAGLAGARSLLRREARPARLLRQPAGARRLED